MKLFIHIVVLLFISQCVKSQNLSDKKWEDFKYAEAGFGIKAPGLLHIKSKEIPTELGLLEIDNYSIVDEKTEPNFLYAINHVRYEKGTFHRDSTALIRAAMEEALAFIIESNQSKLVYKAEAFLDQYNGILFRLMSEKGIVIKGKIFTKQDNMYTIMVFTHRDKSLNREMDMFLDSFSFL